MAKRLLALFLCVFLLTTIAAGCNQEGTTDGTTNGTTDGTTKGTTKGTTASTSAEGLVIAKTGYPVVTEEITFEGIMPDNTRKPYNENTVADWMKEITGITIDMTTIASDVYQEKVGILLAGGDYPDFFYMADMTRANQQLYGSDSGILIDMKPLIEDGWAENFKRFSDDNADIYRIACIEDSLYALPFLMNDLNEPLYMINKTWMDAVGKGMPTNLDEMTELLRAFKNEDPNKNGDADEIPISSAGNIYWYNPIITCFGLTTTGWQEDDNGQVFHGTTTQNYKDYLTWTAQIYEEGLLDARVPTGAINDEQIVADMTMGKVGMIYTAHTDWLQEDVADQMVGFMPFAYGTNATGVWPKSITLVQGTFCITDKCEYPEAMLRWVDYWYTEEGQIMMWNGREGETYEIAEDNSIKIINIPSGMKEEEFRNTWSIQGHHYYPGFYSYFTNQHTTLPRKLAYINGRAALVPISKKAISEYSLTPEESDAISVMSTDIGSYIDNSEAKFMAGELKVDTDWQTFLDTLIAMGLETVQETIQNAVDRFYGKN